MTSRSSACFLRSRIDEEKIELAIRYAHDVGWQEGYEEGLASVTDPDEQADYHRERQT